MLGRHQASNAAVALAVLDQLRQTGWRLPENDVRRGLASLKWPARMQIVARHPTVILDAAHNTASTQCLLDALEESFAAPRRILVFATTQGKDVDGMLRLLLPNFDAVVLTQYLHNARAFAATDLEKIAAQLPEIPRLVCPDPAAAWDRVGQLATPDHLICITGSFFLAAEMQSVIQRRPMGSVSKSMASLQIAAQ